MKKTLTTLAAVGIAASAAAIAAPAASAAEPAPVQNWTPMVSEGACNTGAWNGPTSNGSIVPIIVGNYTPEPMTGSYTSPINGVQFSPSFDAAMQSAACLSVVPSQSAGSVNFTVQPYSATVVWASFYGENKSTLGKEQNIGFGGAPNGTRGAGWFDLNPQFQGGINTSNLASISTAYSGTGGTNGSNQNNFNLVACDTNLTAMTVGLTPTVITPYSGGWTQGPTYQPFAPICAAWMPQGKMVNFDSTPSGGITAQAAQLNGSTISFAGGGAVSGMSMAYQVQGTSNPAANANVIVPLGTTPGSAPFLTVNAAGEWAALNIPNPGSGIVNLLADGQVVASWNTQ